MPDFSYFFLSVTAFFFFYCTVQFFISLKEIKGVYLFYGTYLLIIFCYFFVIQTPHGEFNYWRRNFESFLFSGITISYLIFAKSFYSKRDSYNYFRVIANAGLYVILISFLLERLLSFSNVEQIHIIEGVLRGFTALIGIYAVTFTYIKVPADRSFAIYFLIGNYTVIVGGILTLFFTVTGSLLQDNYPAYAQMTVKTRFIPIQIAVIMEMLLFSVAIVKRQLVSQSLLLDDKLPKNQNLSSETQQDSSEQRIALKTSRGFDILKKQDIILLQGGGNSANFIKVFVEGYTTPILALHTLNNAQQLLHGESPVFLRIHRSYIVNVEKIKSLYKDEDGVIVVSLINNMEIPVSKEKIEEIKRFLGLS
ncbi:MAG: LytTR family transcriptional regulator DNA-binding domain-containing protein [Saprospiraceae bacterium]